MSHPDQGLMTVEEHAAYATDEIPRLAREIERLTRRNAELTASEDAMASKLRIAEAHRKMVCSVNEQLRANLDGLLWADGPVKQALSAAWDDIGEWCQLAQRQHDELQPVGHHPLAPTPAGIEKSRRVQRLISDALKALTPHEA